MGRFLSRGFASAAHLFLLHRFFVRSHSRFFVPTRPLLTAARTGAVRVGRRTNLSACSALARPYLDGSPAQRIFFSFIGSLFDLTAVSSFRRALCSRRRAQGPSGLAVAPTFPHAPPWPGHTLTAPTRRHA